MVKIAKITSWKVEGVASLGVVLGWCNRTIFQYFDFVYLSVHLIIMPEYDSTFSDCVQSNKFDLQICEVVINRPVPVYLVVWSQYYDYLDVVWSAGIIFILEGCIGWRWVLQLRNVQARGPAVGCGVIDGQLANFRGRIAAQPIFKYQRGRGRWRGVRLAVRVGQVRKCGNYCWGLWSLAVQESGWSRASPRGEGPILIVKDNQLIVVGLDCYGSHIPKSCSVYEYFINPVVPAPVGQAGHDERAGIIGHVDKIKATHCKPIIAG